MADKIKALETLKQDGFITEEEFNNAKKTLSVPCDRTL
jgi:hypothetical protein